MLGSPAARRRRPAATVRAAQNGLREDLVMGPGRAAENAEKARLRLAAQVAIVARQADRRPPKHPRHTQQEHTAHLRSSKHTPEREPQCGSPGACAFPQPVHPPRDSESLERGSPSAQHVHGPTALQPLVSRLLRLPTVPRLRAVGPPAATSLAFPNLSCVRGVNSRGAARNTAIVLSPMFRPRRPPRPRARYPGPNIISLFISLGARWAPGGWRPPVDRDQDARAL